jgi:hypothetical protein
MCEEYDKSCRISNIFLAGAKSIRFDSFENMLEKKKKKWKGKDYSRMVLSRLNWQSIGNRRN